MATRHTTVDTLVVGTVFVALATHTGGWGAVNLANVNAVTGTLPVGNGGTGQASFAAGVIHSTGAALASSLVVNADITVGTINLDKLAQSGAASGQVATWSGTAWVPSPASGGTITGVTAGAGLTGGGVSGVVTIDVVAADGTIVVNANSIQVGVVPVAQLSAGSNGQILTVVTGVPTWVSASGSVTLAGDVTGPSSSNTITNLAVSKLAPGAANTVLWSNGSVNSFTGSPILSTSLAIGTNPASAGAIRLGNNQAINSRNAANSSDFNLVSLNASNIVVVGAEFASGIQAPWFDSFGVIHTDDAGHLSVSLIVASDITNATITTAKIAPGTSGQVFVTNATPAAAWVAPAGDWVGPVAANTIQRITGSGGVVAIGASNFVWDSAASHVSLSHTGAASGDGGTFDIIAQPSFQSGNTFGGPVRIFGGQGHGTGAAGGFQLGMGGLAGTTMLIAREVASAGHRVLGILGDANDTDASSGADLFVHWHDAATIPSSSSTPGNGGFLWELGGRFFHKGKYGLTTTLAGDGAQTATSPTFEDIKYGQGDTTGTGGVDIFDIDLVTVYGSASKSFVIRFTVQGIDLADGTVCAFEKIIALSWFGGALTSYGLVSEVIGAGGNITPVVSESLSISPIPLTSRIRATAAGTAGRNYKWFGKAELSVYTA